MVNVAERNRSATAAIRTACYEDAPFLVGISPVLRTLLLLAAAAFLGGCASTPLAPLTVDQTKFRDQELRLMFAKLIAGSNGFGADNWLVGKRYYSNAQVNVPPRDNGIGIICAKVTIRNETVGVRELDISAQTIEGPGGTSLRMSNYPDYFGSRCKTPFTPFPELELLSAK